MNQIIRMMKAICILLLLFLANGCSGMGNNMSCSGLKNEMTGIEKNSEQKPPKELHAANAINMEKELKEKRLEKENAITEQKSYGYKNGDRYLKQYSAIPAVRQIILVEQSKETVSTGTLFLLVKNSDGDWEEKLRCKAYLGKNGLDKMREGDVRTPTGDYGFIMAFGAKDDPGSLIPYTKLTDSMYLCGDRDYYNQFIDSSKIDHRCSNNSEHLIQYIPQYNYALFIDYNKEGVYGKGSAIFLHCFGNYPYTLGCVSVAEENMKKILRTADTNSRICIYHGS